MKSPPEPSETLSSSSAGPSRPFFSITSPQLQEEFRKERLRRLEARGDVNGTSSPPSPQTLSSSPSSKASPLRISYQAVPPLSPSFPAASPLRPSSSQPVSPMRTSSPQAVSPLRTSSPQAFSPLRTSSPQVASPLRTSSPEAASPLRTSSPQASPLDSPFSLTPSDSPSTPLKSSPWHQDGSPALSLSSPELLSELKQGRSQPLRRVPEKKGLTTVFSGRGRQVSGSSPIA